MDISTFTTKDANSGSGKELCIILGKIEGNTWPFVIEAQLPTVAIPIGAELVKLKYLKSLFLCIISLRLCIQLIYRKKIKKIDHNTVNVEPKVQTME